MILICVKVMVICDSRCCGNFIELNIRSIHSVLNFYIFIRVKPLFSLPDSVLEFVVYFMRQCYCIAILDEMNEVKYEEKKRDG